MLYERIERETIQRSKKLKFSCMKNRTASIAAPTWKLECIMILIETRSRKKNQFESNKEVLSACLLLGDKLM